MNANEAKVKTEEARKNITKRLIEYTEKRIDHASAGGDSGIRLLAGEIPGERNADLDKVVKYFKSKFYHVIRIPSFGSDESNWKIYW